MQRVDGHLVLSATDLTKHLACPHITTLDLAAAEHASGAPVAQAADDALNLIFAKGLDHERAYLAHLRRRGLTVVEVTGFGRDRAAAEAETLAAMRDGVDVVYQATLYDGEWVGHADFLLRRDRPSNLGPWSYDIADTKLARRLKVPALLQMAMYADRLATLQGVAPERLVVVTGDGAEHPWRLLDVDAYARRARRRLELAVTGRADTESSPVAHCVQCRWQAACASQWEAADDLSLVAGMRSDHRAALREHGVQTLEALAKTDPDDLAGVLSRTVRERLCQQARLQVVEREAGVPAYELLEPEPGRGLQRLPEPSPGDVYLDFEGDPWAQGGAGREYLAGLWDRSGQFTAWWAHDFEQEAQLTRDLLDDLVRRWRADPGMHVYHYAPYERTALQRLTGRHGTREAELDQLLRGGRLVDLYAVVHQGVRISKPSYSIKKLEEFYWGHTRTARDEQEVADAMTSVVEYERYLTERDERILEQLARYNREDVRSTHDLHGWLEERRAGLADGGAVLQRPPAESEAAAVEPGEDERAEEELAQRLLESGHALLAGCVGWHRREARPAWWDFFRYADLDTARLVEDGTALGGLGAPEQSDELVSAKTGRVTSRVWRYRFEPQDCALRVDAAVHDVDTHDGCGTLVGLDAVAGWADVKRGVRLAPVAARGFGPPGPIGDGVLRSAIAGLGAAVLAGRRPLGAALLDRLVPPADVLAARPGESPRDVVVRVGQRLDGSVLAVQGPPGSGKTSAASELVRALLDEGKKVGVTALSHAVIRNLLKGIGRPAVHRGSLPKEGSTHTDADDDITIVDDNAAVVAALADGTATLVGGTAWLWAREELAASVDVLVVDEAGQFSLANALAVSGAARSIVLLGDPQQLTQPTQALHPHGAGVSALDHLLDGHDTIAADRGVFLDTTYRMHPAITEFVSTTSYDGRLTSAPDRERQRIDAPGRLRGNGLRWLPLAHTGCVAESPQEARLVADLLADLLRGTWTDVEGRAHDLTLADVLVVAPYNAQVAALRAALPEGARVGTVDKFQGQQAPVVIYSMASSSAADAPRGVDFLHDPHRLNVAVSRARALAVVVGSEALLDAEVRTPAQLAAVNALCRFAEMARPAGSD